MSNYFFKNTPLQNLFTTNGASPSPGIQTFYKNFPPIATAVSTNTNGVIQNDIGFYINNQKITQLYPIIANYSTFNTFTNPISVPTWCNSIACSITTPQGNSGAAGNTPSPPYQTTIQTGMDCDKGRIPQCVSNYTTYTAPSGNGGPGGPGGPGILTKTTNPYIFGSTLSFQTTANSISLKDGSQQIITCNYGGQGGQGNNGNFGNVYTGNVMSTGNCLNNVQPIGCQQQWPRDRVVVSGTTGTIGVEGAQGNSSSNIPINNTPSTANTASAKIYFFTK
jgi:hypothetical protein